MRRRKKVEGISSYEFELDLAPLLSVMMKLVPVMLLSTAFVQVMMIESDLPQAVKEAIAKQDDKKIVTTIQIAADANSGFKVIVAKGSEQMTHAIPMLGKDSYDFKSLHKHLQGLKTQHPDIFKVELAPAGNVAYKDVVKIMDEARRSRDKEVRFPIFDAKENKQTMTDYMFPDVVFANMMDG